MSLIETAEKTPSNYYSCAVSVVGHVRKINEDAFLDAREQGLWVVADGMGGHSRGDRASQSIVHQLQPFIASKDPEQDLQQVITHLDEANRFCRDVAEGQVMGSTVAALLVCANQAHLIWAGDSRIYRYRQGELNQLTDDHSLVMELHRMGELTEDEAENHPSANVITRAVGVSDDLEIQVRQADLLPGDRFLLCSDGLFKDVHRTEVAANLGLPAPQYALDALVKLALKRGGTDNITAIVVQLNTQSITTTAPP